MELSYLSPDEQHCLAEQIKYIEATPSHAQAIKMREFTKNGKLGRDVIESIMCEDKSNQRPKINIQYDQGKKNIPSSVPYERTGDYILKALEYYHRYLERQRDNVR